MQSTSTPSAHTPGPWAHFGIANPPVEIRVIRNGAAGRVIAFVVTEADEFEANARLIAAAPDLLDACNDLLNCTDLNVDELDTSSIAAIHKAQRIIAKAESTS